MKAFSKIAIAGCLLASGAMASGAQAATTVNWSFDGTFTGTGELTYDAAGVVTALTGTYDSQALSLVTFTTDPNNPGAEIGNPDGQGNYTYRGVPNTGGANYTFDNKLALDDNGILVSTGTGDAERVYNLTTYFMGTPDFFSINADGSYRHDFGSFTTSPTAAVPEPASWAMMIGGIGLAGGMMRRRRSATRVVFAA